MKRIDALRVIAGLTTPEDLFISSVGGLIDDWWNVRPGQVDNTMSLSILGSVSSTALGLALALPHRRVVALETDGSVLMNLGAVATLATRRPPNLTVVVLDNGLYECIGSAPTLTSAGVDLAAIAAGAGCAHAVAVHDEAELGREVATSLDAEDLGYVVARIEPGMESWPPEQRRYTDGVEDKYRFVRYVEKLEGRRIHGGAPHV
ncbi:thiamine pyrophosphate-dependent enzyme [Nocardioides sp. LHG3406-4]|uniref:thiamine pyrophosphate-dependent enzyme n=1 Tax=Nocardioides sp. LHG3406-4 TaxID=2804575 RepID=UPI003CEA03A0